MKTIPLRTEGNFKTIDLIKEVTSNSAQGMNVAQMRARIRVLDAVAALAPDATTISLEDGDLATLQQAVSQVQWKIADKALMAAIDDILGTAPAAA